jgi:hypothetical protein
MTAPTIGGGAHHLLRRRGCPGWRWVLDRLHQDSIGELSVLQLRQRSGPLVNAQEASLVELQSLSMPMDCSR